MGQDVIDPNERNDAGWTPLHKIASVNQTSSAAECVKTLIDNGAKIDIKDNNGNTPVKIHLFYNLILPYIFSIKSLKKILNTNKNNF